MRYGGEGVYSFISFGNLESPELRVYDLIVSLYGCLFHMEGRKDYVESCTKLVAKNLYIV